MTANKPPVDSEQSYLDSMKKPNNVSSLPLTFDGSHVRPARRLEGLS